MARRLKGVARGTIENMRKGFRANFDPNVKGGIANFAAQAKALYGRRKKKKE